MGKIFNFLVGIFVETPEEKQAREKYESLRLYFDTLDMGKTPRNGLK